MKQSGVIKMKLPSASVDKKLLLSIALVGLLAVNATAGVFGIELGARQTKLEADFSYTSSLFTTATKINLKDIGLADSTSTFKPTLFWQEGNHRFDFDYEQIGFNGSHTLTKRIGFGPNTYVPGMDIESELDLRWFRISYKYRLLGDNKSYLNLGVDINSMIAEINITAPKYGSNLNKVIAKDSSFGLVVNGNYAFTNRFGIEGKLAALLGYQEAYAGLNMDLFKNAQLRAGYQYTKLEFDLKEGSKEFDADFKLKGAFVALNYRF